MRKRLYHYDPVPFGDWVAYYRIKDDSSLQELAGRVPCSVSALCRVEKGMPVLLTTAVAVVKALGREMDELLGRKAPRVIRPGPGRPRKLSV